MGTAITKVSSRGQIVVPTDLRRILKLKEGTKLLIYTKGNILIAKKLSEPVVEKTFEEIVEPIRARAEKSNVKKSDVERTISEYRSKR